MKKKIKALVLDLDGTLIDSLQDITMAVNHTMKELGYPTKNINFIENAIGNGAKTLLKACFPKGQRIDNHIYDLFISYYNSNCSNQTELYPGVIDFLNNTIHIKKAILTNKPIIPTLKIIKSLGIDQFFELVIGGDSFSYRKPHPIGLEKIIKAFSISPHEALMIGDGPQDIQAANAIGMDSIGIINRIGNKMELLQEKPTYIVQNFDEISKLLLD